MVVALSKTAVSGRWFDSRADAARWPATLRSQDTVKWSLSRVAATTTHPLNTVSDNLTYKAELLPDHGERRVRISPDDRMAC